MLNATIADMGGGRHPELISRLAGTRYHGQTSAPTGWFVDATLLLCLCALPTREEVHQGQATFRSAPQPVRPQLPMCGAMGRAR